VSRGQRLAVFAAGVLGLLLLAVPAARHLPAFGTPHHPLRDLAVTGSVAHKTANAVSSVNFDQRAYDTLGEELILLASVTGAMALLRPRKDEREDRRAQGGEVLPPVRLLAYLLLPVTIVLGADVVIHGQITPGGGFQGGIVLASGLHLLYVGGTMQELERLRPLEAFDVVEAAGEIAYLGVGIAGFATAAGFLANFLPLAPFGTLLSAGIVPVLSLAVGIEVGAGVVILLAAFLRQAVTLEEQNA
jgi:multicomponent Na+:H+ antiporter subunit B